MATIQNPRQKPVEAIIWTEGKTDWKHLKKAHEKLRQDLGILFHEAEEGDLGADALFKKCKVFAETPQSTPMVFIFDRDVALVKNISSDMTQYRDWGNNVFSFAIPVPNHRKAQENICIEFYYSDEELTTRDHNGRRLFLSTEFNEISGTHQSDPTIHIGNTGKIKGATIANKAKIIDSQVFRSDTNIALSKADFSEYIYTEAEPFSKVDFKEFRKIFDIIATIMNIARPRTTIGMPDLQLVRANLETEGYSQTGQICNIFDLLANVLEVCLGLFSVSTIRYYEDAFSNEPPEYRKKVGPIKRIISERYTAPSLITRYELARHCCYLINEKAPNDLHKMKEHLEKSFVLGAVGDILDELEKMFPPESRKPRFLNKAQMRKSLLDYVIPEIAKYENKIEHLRNGSEEEGKLNSRLDIQIWISALQGLMEVVNPILTQEFILETLDQVDTASHSYKISVRTYTNGTVNISHKSTSFEGLEEYESNISSVLMMGDDTKVLLSLFPFLAIRDDKLYSYKRTRAAGYEYHSLSDSSVFVEKTKRKFSQSALNKPGVKGFQQSLFWTEVMPTVNDINGVKANIPSEGLAHFVGRRNQSKAIKRQIIEIPNQNGIIYGVGGVGKTALMVQVSRELYEEENREEVLFENIIWASAKSHYYNPILSIIQSESKQFKSLDNVISTMLDFFDYEDLEGYNFDDKKGLLLELLLENRVLLVLDNFETITKSDKNAIIDFFGIEVKHYLRRNPDKFKLIITSREQIPCGFHQILLTGLAPGESKQLMTSLYRQYRNAHKDLTDREKEEIYQVSSGIPIVIKHCIGQIYEYNQPFNVVIGALTTAKSDQVVEFSFVEIFKLVSSNHCSIEIILLMEIIGCPLMIRQIADILERNTAEIEDKIPALVSFQCVKRSNLGSEEKYEINDEVRLFVRRLIQENEELVRTIRQRITKTFTIEKQMDYTTEEMGILSIFHNYLSQSQHLEAETFIQDQLHKKPQSILLRYHYAKYLKEQKRENEKAITILEDIRESSNNHPNVLRLLIACYLYLEVPNYAKASIYVKEIEATSIDDEDVKYEIAEFYVRWSISIKMSREVSPDPIKEMLRQQRYKELADRALLWLNQIKHKSHQVFYLLAQSYFNKWDKGPALEMIDKAISLCNRDSRYLSSYSYLQRLILKKEEQYSVRRSIY